MKIPYLFMDLVSTIEKLADKKVIPPIVWLILTPLIIIYSGIAIINSIISYLLGFWRCHDCYEIFHRFNEQFVIHYIGGGFDGDPTKFCQKCSEIREEIKNGH